MSCLVSRPRSVEKKARLQGRGGHLWPRYKGELLAVIYPCLSYLRVTDSEVMATIVYLPKMKQHGIVPCEVESVRQERFKDDTGPRWPVGLLASHQGEPSSIPGRVTPGFSQVGIVQDDAVGRRVFSASSRFPSPYHSGNAPYSPQSPSSALKTSLKRAVLQQHIAKSHQQKPPLPASKRDRYRLAPHWARSLTSSGQQREKIMQKWVSPIADSRQPEQPLEPCFKWGHSRKRRAECGATKSGATADEQLTEAVSEMKYLGVSYGQSVV
ncbi:hypothetical protein PR048_004418 [Dryococelus australis]|uniref:Uncharacterized protein n=1 Tax=Dryococelus australis TaxID=614101 RepID=A0ABQ9I7C1_9NEOP|nr:hypothetical protein PR048_004418 [Dryococelus australis]